MQYLILNFNHGIRDVIPYCDFVKKIKPVLLENQMGEYLGDDMAIDGGDAEATFGCADARALFGILEPHLRGLAFMHKAQVTFVFGPLDSDADSCQITLE